MTESTQPTTTFTYDWQAEPDGFKKWLIPTLLGDVIRDDAVFEELRQRSGSWRRVELRVLVNGHEVDAERFLDVLESVIESTTTRVASRYVDEIGDLRRLRETVDEVAADLRGFVAGVAYQHGIRLPSDDD